jgi:hypothetical protein
LDALCISDRHARQAFMPEDKSTLAALAGKVLTQANDRHVRQLHMAG